MCCAVDVMKLLTSAMGSAVHGSSYPRGKARLDCRAGEGSAGLKCYTSLQRSLQSAEHELFYLLCYAFLGVLRNFISFLYFSQLQPCYYLNQMFKKCIPICLICSRIQQIFMKQPLCLCYTRC